MKEPSLLARCFVTFLLLCVAAMFALPVAALVDGSIADLEPDHIRLASAISSVAILFLLASMLIGVIVTVWRSP